MDNIHYSWKKDENGVEWKVSLSSFEDWARSSFPSYVGNSADANGLTLWFAETVTEEERELIDLEWNDLDKATEEMKIQIPIKIEAAIVAAKAGIVSQSWNQLISAERKLVLNLPLTDADKTALLNKYPQE